MSRAKISIQIMYIIMYVNSFQVLPGLRTLTHHHHYVTINIHVPADVSHQKHTKQLLCYPLLQSNNSTTKCSPSIRKVWNTESWKKNAYSRERMASYVGNEYLLFYSLSVPKYLSIYNTLLFPRDDNKWPIQP